MSSLTISTTVCRASQPSSELRGLNTRTLGAPGGRLSANSHREMAEPARSSSDADRTSSGVTVA